MTKREPKVREYVLHRDGTTRRWELRLGFGERDDTNVVARSVMGEDKDAFESLCRDYVRTSSLSAARNLPRRLRIEDVDGFIIETASYDAD